MTYDDLLAGIAMGICAAVALGGISALILLVLLFNRDGDS